MLATSGTSAISGSTRSHQGVDRGLDREGTLNSERRIEKRAGANQSGFPVSLIVVIEQWICLGLGMICIIAGAFGISMSTSQNDLSTHLAWMGLGYVPLLRITAAACVALGIVLVRLGCTSRWPQPAGGSDM
jgi:hypothetical protein